MSFVAEVQDKMFNTIFQFLNNLEDVVRQYLKDVKAKVLHMKKVSALQNETVVSPLIIYLFKLMRFPLVIMYYIYVMPFMVISNKLWVYATLAVKIVCRRSPHARHIVEHIIALFVICKSVLVKILSSKLTELIAFCITTIFEIINAVLWPSTSPPASMEKELSMVLSVDELAELLAYEEVDADGDESVEAFQAQYPRGIRGMHNYIPSNPFKATIRIHRSVPMAHLQSKSRTGSELVSAAGEPGSCLVDYMGADSPASFPPTPYSRANVMNRSLDRVASVMFAARDRLRLEAQSVSRDEYSRMLAKEARSSGQYAVFDPHQSSSGVQLSCGNHCATKVGKGLCCCCRSMMPVRPNAYVYFEFSVMVSSAQTPTLGIGLSPKDCPTNVMVGSWPCSQGLYNDGQMLIGSHWYQSTNGKKIEAGSNIGMLVYIPSVGTQEEADLDLLDSELGLLEGISEHSDHTSEKQTEDLNHSKGPSSIFGSILKSFSRSNSLDPDDSFGLALSSCENSAHNSKENSPENKKTKLVSTDASAEDAGEGTAGTTKQNMLFHFTVNGEPILYPVEASKCLEEIVSTNTPLYPTVSLFSEETRVWCRFCEADVIYRSRAQIGAPPGVRVYCLDGTLLLKESD